MKLGDINKLLEKIGTSTNPGIFQTQLMFRSKQKLFASVTIDSSISPIDFTVVIRDTTSKARYNVSGSMLHDNKSFSVNYYPTIVDGDDDASPVELEKLQQFIGFLVSHYRKDRAVVYKVYDQHDRTEKAVVLSNVAIKSMYVIDSGLLTLPDMRITNGTSIDSYKRPLIDSGSHELRKFVDTLDLDLAAINDGNTGYIKMII